jgi:chemotaxis signal transduction protein
MNSKANSYILFELAGTTYGLPTREVQHVEMLDHVTPVPNSAAAVEGVVFSRGQVVPALNLRTLFGLPAQAKTVRTRLIVLRFEERLIGLIVDQAREFQVLPEQVIQPVEATVSRLSGSFLEATATVGGRLILLPSLRAILDNATAAAGSASAPRLCPPSSPPLNAHSP